MNIQPMDLGLSAVKRQMDIALQMTEVLIEAAEKTREIQLAAAVEAHAALDATRKSLQSASTLPELLELQSRLATENLGKMLNYWSSLAGTAGEMQSRIAEIVPGAKIPEKAA